MKKENNQNINQDESEQQNASGNMYSYRDNNNPNIQELGAIRRSIGEGNPNLDYIQNNLGLGYNQNYINNGKVEIQYSQSNNINPNHNTLFYLPYIFICIIELVIIVILCVFFEYKIKFDDSDKFDNYKLLRDMNIMVFVGFSMIHSILRRNSWMSILINCLVVSFAVQLAIFFNLLWKNAFNEEWEDETINFTYLMKAIFISSSVLVTLGCALGKLSVIQYIILAILETFLCSLNYQLCEEKLKIIDYGGALYIHTFGTMFGISISTVLFCSSKIKTSFKNYNYLNKSNYFSNLTLFIGMIFLFSYFPTFNSALAKESAYDEIRKKGIYSTYLSLFGSTIGSFITSGFLNSGRFIFEEILYGTLSGAIIISGCCTLCIDHWAPMVVGTLGAIISVVLLSKIKPYFVKWGLQDTCNIIIIHGIIGLLGAFITPMFIRGFESRNTEETKIYNFGREFSDQAGIQVGGIFTTIGISFIGGIATGYLMKICLCGKINQYFTDSEFFVEEEKNIFDYIEQNIAFNVDINNPSLFKTDNPAYNQKSRIQDIRGSRPSY